MPTQLTQFKQRNTKSNVLIDKHLIEIGQLYDEGISLTKIGEKFEIDRKALERLFKNNGIEPRKIYRQRNLNEHYFDNIDTEEKAYMLGFIYADGNNFPSKNRISIKLSIVDKEILQKFSQILYGDEHLTYVKRKNKNGKEFEYVTLNTFSKHMSQTLVKFGVVERKSHCITFPEWLDKDLYRHFIRGLIDGDGWIYLPKNNKSPCVGLICTRSMNDFLLNFYQNEFNIKSYLCKAYKQDLNVMCEIRVKNYHQCNIFLNWLYEGATIYLQRKFDIYQNFQIKYSNLRKQNR